MSVLVKGMKMPKSCKECQVSFGYGNDEYCPFLFEPNDAIEDELMWKECPKEGRLADCPLVEIPTPHGRLGDLDKLKAQYVHGKADDEIESAWISNIRRAIANAPTVIEAEGSEE